MSKVAVILADGFEEIEALTVVDVLRRANIDCDMVGFKEQITGSQIMICLFYLEECQVQPICVIMMP